KLAKKRIPTAISTAGYWIEIGARHQRQRPRSHSQATTGTLSNGAIPFPHEGQREGGETTDSPRGRRWMQTFANEPKTRPVKSEKTPKRTTSDGASIMRSRASCRRRRAPRRSGERP